MSVATVAVAQLAEVTIRTHTVCPLLIVPAAVVNEPLQPIEYSDGEEMPIATLEPAPEIVMAFDWRTLSSGASDCAMKVVVLSCSVKLPPVAAWTSTGVPAGELVSGAMPICPEPFVPNA